MFLVPIKVYERAINLASITSENEKERMLWIMEDTLESVLVFTQRSRLPVELFNTVATLSFRAWQELLLWEQSMSSDTDNLPIRREQAGSISITYGRSEQAEAILQKFLEDRVSKINLLLIKRLIIPEPFGLNNNRIDGVKYVGDEEVDEDA